MRAKCPRRLPFLAEAPLGRPCHRPGPKRPVCWEIGNGEFFIPTIGKTATRLAALISR